MARPKPKVADLVEQGKWMHAKDLVKVILAAKDKVLAAVKAHGLNPTTAKDLHDLALGCTMFGYLPPTRLACLATLQHPQYKGPCLDMYCKQPNCVGNKLKVLNRDPVSLQLYLPHHKNQGAWSEDGPIYFEVPAELAELLYMWVTKGHAELCQHYFLLEEGPAPTVFMSASGKRLNSNSMQYFWHNWLKKHGGVANMPPSMCRHIFVAERRSDDRVQGPSDRGAAMAMGNSQEAWDRYYEVERHFHPKDCQTAVDEMITWRHNVSSTPSPASNLIQSALASLVPSNPEKKPCARPLSSLASLVPTSKHVLQQSTATAPDEDTVIVKRRRQHFVIESDSEQDSVVTHVAC